MSIAKEQAKKLLEQIPESATWDDIMYQLYVRAKITEGLKDIEQGKLVSHEEVIQRFLPDLRG
jgi:predicted transcriptional regulator